MSYHTVSAWVDVEVDFDELDTDDLIDELESRGYEVLGADLRRRTNSEVSETRTLLNKIYEARRCGRPFETDLDQLLYDTIGRIL
jgi:transcription initiation factor IIE alpha subunit